MAENLSTDEDCKSASDESENLAVNNSKTQSHDIVLMQEVSPTGNEIGSSAYGRVFEVKCEGTLCAAKEIVEHMAQHFDKEVFLSCCRIWSNIRHPHVVQLLGVYYSEKVKEQAVLPVMVMEKMQQNWKDLIEKYENIPWNVKLSILHDVCLGLRYLHSKNPCIVHCNLTPSNILLGSHLEAKITDIGVAKLWDSSNDTTMKSKVAYLPPEAIGKNPIYVPSFDVFLFGRVSFYIVTQVWPKLSQFSQTQSNNADTDKWKAIPLMKRYSYLFTEIVPDLKPLIVSCLDENLENRPSMSQISVILNETREKYELNRSGGKNPIVWSAQVSREQHSQKKQPPSPPQQQQFTRSSTTFWSNYEQTWQQSIGMPEKCWVTSATEMDGKVYVSALVQDQFSSFMYEVDTQEWSLLPVLSRYYFVLVAVNRKKQLLAVGGSKFALSTMCNNVFLLDEKHKDWTLRYPDMPTPRCSVTGICHHSTMVVAGGITQWNPWTLTRVVEVLHINEGTPSDSYWSAVEQLPHGIYAAIPLLWNEHIYISSFIDCDELRGNNTFTVLTASITELLDSNNDNSSSNSLWGKLSDPPYSSYSMICFHGHLITFTGSKLVEEANKSEPIHKLVPMIHIYNPVTLSWDCVGYVSFGYALGRSVCIGENSILFIGGVTGTYNHYDSTNWIHANLQLELRPAVHKLHPSIITY